MFSLNCNVNFYKNYYVRQTKKGNFDKRKRVNGIFFILYY